MNIAPTINACLMLVVLLSGCMYTPVHDRAGWIGQHLPQAEPVEYCLAPQAGGRPA